MDKDLNFDQLVNKIDGLIYDETRRKVVNGITYIESIFSNTCGKTTHYMITTQNLNGTSRYDLYDSEEYNASIFSEVGSENL